MKKQEKIVGKIKALLAKTIENGATREEMESSLKKANELMLEFFISECDLIDNETMKKLISKKFEITKSGFDMSFFYYDLHTLFDCKSFYNSLYITFFGHEQDVEMCGYFYQLITKSCLKEKDKYLKSDEYKYLKRYNHGKTLSANFIKGFLIEVSEKMKEMYIERQSNIPASYGLMVIDKKEKVQKGFDDMNLKLRKVTRKQINSDNMAFEAGSLAGSNFNIIQGINDSKEKSNLLT